MHNRLCDLRVYPNILLRWRELLPRGRTLGLDQSPSEGGMVLELWMNDTSGQNVMETSEWVP